jgi:phytoene dehydrogenase-like protein
MAGSEFDVAVIGAGVAGLAAASALAERGKRVIVLEA